MSTTQTLRLYEWDSGATLAPMVLPVRHDETPEQAAFRYLTELSKNACMMNLFENKLPQLPLRGFSLLEEASWEPRVLMIANLPYDYSLHSPRVLGFQKVFSVAKERSFILPINVNLGLTCEETKELFALISKHFPFMVAMGGDDVDPSLYKQINEHCRKVIPGRDQFEASLIRSYVEQENGFLLGICRGSQIASVALGYELIQDLPHQVGNTVAHANDWHPIEIQNTQHNILKSITPADGQLIVNSIHHQSVVYREGGLLEIAARAPDGVTEATEFKNGRGLLLQFHPELMNNDLGAEILLRALAQRKRG
ncbi:gamma-glutamyl-gamma-aminobutyrate hydrolase family protein [Bdellovibrio svalbardensis]|uniref:Gamma-glutamyl-gamma-aminobutyrate hydrolase family protein n=1 Tax=Bdellovibrio svalbardensis TaxID=2972972 RepID=A0ABT6DII1_9BACT|nr:gamma-glutamyl-gamma-aminobutyrate hydrolase family protein [Bdellovibrio svalbardensis]MDG0816317.1 gamma-glutamyl-gamma-aminobutyrate hydrolase family protein [Bdellovibrio svalbardensis]